MHVCVIVQVISVTKLRKEYSQYEARRKLCGMHDLFLADDRYNPTQATLTSQYYPAASQTSWKDIL